MTSAGDARPAARRDALARGCRIVLDPANLFETRRTGGARAGSSTRRSTCSADHIAMAHAKDRDADGGFATAGQGVVDFPTSCAACARPASTGRS